MPYQCQAQPNKRKPQPQHSGFPPKPPRKTGVATAEVNPKAQQRAHCGGTTIGDCYNDTTVTVKMGDCLTFTDMRGVKSWYPLCTVTRVEIYW